MSMNSTIFQANPTTINISRSKFDLSHENTFTFNAGRLIPCYHQDVLPGDTFKLDMQAVVRMTTPIAPVMDNAFMDVYFFFVPNKLVLSRQMMSPSTSDSNRSWSAIVGAQDSLLNMPLPADGVTIPTINFGTGGYQSDQNFGVGSLSDYLGLPDVVATTAGKRNVSCLKPLAYYSVWNNYFRDPNNMNPVTYSITGTNVLLNGGAYDYVNLSNIGFNSQVADKDSILPVCRTGNYFSSCLPWPQRNSTAVTLPIGDIAPLITTSNINEFGSVAPVLKATGAFSGSKALAVDFGSGQSFGVLRPSALTAQAEASPYFVATNVAADLSNATAASVNQIRYAFAMQRWYERLARGGNSLADLTKTMFGVTPSWAHADRPEYLGGKRIPLMVEQVNATAGTAETGTQIKLGSTGAYSLTYTQGSMFTKSFDTWGTIIGVCCVRTDESFHQGLERDWSRKDKFSLYWSSFANIGEQPVLNKEIYFDGSDSDDGVFGYQEAWAEYRYRNNYKCGLSRPGKDQAYWNYCNNFASRPSLKGYIDGTSIKDNIDRTLQVTSSAAGFQFMSNMHFDVKAVRPLPTYSVPGLVDHQ